jgi:ferredoxin, 2Fe-2S
MHKIHILPIDVVIDAEEGTSIMEAANASGFYWPTTCGGQGICTTCAGVIVSGADHLSEMGRSERRSLTENRGASSLGQSLRLCCQARVYGSVQVRKPGGGIKGQTFLVRQPGNWDNSRLSFKSRISEASVGRRKRSFSRNRP